MTAALLSLSYNTLDIIRETYPRMRATFSGPFVIMDNASSDGSAEWLAEQPDLADLTLYSPENTGYTAGCNQLIELARSRWDPDWYVLINSDVTVPEGVSINVPGMTTDAGWADELLLPFADAPEAWVVGCRLTMEGFVVHGGGRRSGSWRLRFCREIYEVGEYEVVDQSVVAPTRLLHRIGFRDDWTDVEQVPWVTFALVAIRREAVERVGLLDERFFLYSSDAEYCLRVAAAGGQVWYNGHVTMEHMQGGERSVERAGRDVVERGINDLVTFYQEVERTWAS